MLNCEQTDWAKAFGEWMRRERVLANLTRKQIAVRIGVGVNAIERWEYGQRRPLVDSFVAWTQAVGVPLEKAIRQLALFMNRASTAVQK